MASHEHFQARTSVFGAALQPLACAPHGAERLRRSLMIVGLAAAALSAGQAPAAAESRLLAPSTSRVAPPSIHLARSEPKTTAATAESSLRAAPARSPAEAPPPLLAIVSIGSQHIDVYGPNGPIARSRVSTGTSSNPTPTGVFSILQRNRYHESNIYSNAPMPFMQRLTWSGIALHQGHVPNYPASHGCIRLPAQFAQSMWGIGRIGMRVIVSPSDVKPVAFQHPRLPAPRMSLVTRSAELVQVATNGPAAVDVARALSPYEAARARAAKAAADKVAADRAVKPAHDLAARKAAEANNLPLAIKASAGILADAEEHLDFENLAMVTVQTPAAEEPILARIRIAQAAVAAAREAHEKLKAAERTVVDESFAAASAARRAREDAEAAAAELTEARRALEPIAIFVSRRTGQVHIRQGFQPLHEEPVTISDADRPLGTHVFTAIDEQDNGRSLSWVAVSMPTSGGETPRRQRGEPASSRDRQTSSASEALDRIELPETTRTLISERMWPGASLIVSDFGLGETGSGTDFVILTK